MSSVPPLASITLGGARAPLASVRPGAPLIGRGRFIVLIQDELQLAAFCETSLAFPRRVYTKTLVSQRAGAGSGGAFASVLNSAR